MAAATTRVDSTPYIAGKTVIGNRGLGLLGSEIPSTGLHGPSLIYPSLDLPADANKQYRILRPASLPSGVTSLFIHEDGSFELTGDDGLYEFDVGLYENGTLLGDIAVTVNINEPVTATLTRTDANDTLASVAANWGVLGSTVTGTGEHGPAILFNEVQTYGLQANYVNFEVLSVTAGYTLTTDINSSFEVTGPLGRCTITYRFSIDGVWQTGTGTVDVDFATFADFNREDAADTLSSTVAVDVAPITVVATLDITDAADTLVSAASINMVVNTKVIRLLTRLIWETIHNGSAPPNIPSSSATPTEWLRNNTKVYVGESGVAIILECDSDISSATSFSIDAKKPDNTTVSLIGRLSGPRAIRFDTQYDTFDQPGNWKLQAKITSIAGIGKSEPVKLTIYRGLVN